MLNKTINGYTIKRKLGEGGMADVWYAENKIGKPAAVKILHPDLALNASIAERFLNEAKVMVKLNHHNIRQVYDYDEVEGKPCIIMEYLEGKDLKTIVNQKGALDTNTASLYWNQIVAALHYTHEKGIIHRDIKPSNIFVTDEGEVKLLDFGIAKVRDTVTGTQTGQKLGTLVYMSPEQITDAKHVDRRTDFYSLAVTFVHLLTGCAPYDADSSSEYAIMDQIVKHPLNMKSVPSAWQQFLQPYLAKRPEERPTLIPSNNDKAQKEIQSSGSHSHFSASNDDTYVEPSNKLVGELNVGKDRIFKIKDIPFKMVYLEGGAFEMGCTYSFFGETRKNESPVHWVKLSDFHLAETPVTQALWIAVMGNNPSKFKEDNLPVENVCWNDCLKFIQKLNKLTGKTFRLPTEAEWEYAARGGNKSQHYKYAGSDTIGNVAWYTDNSSYATHPAKGKQANELGLYDMSGNVYEWCQDWYGDYSGSEQTNPTGPSSGSRRVLRGGSWFEYARFCRVSSRFYFSPVRRNNGIGFRLALPCE